MTQERFIATDTETTGTRPFQGDRCTMASFADETGAWAVPREQAGAELRKHIDQGKTLIMHNSPFDRAVYSTSFGIELRDDKIWDTQAVDWLLDENADHRLKEGLGVRMFGVDAKAEKDELRALMRGRSVAEVYRELRDEVNVAPRKERERATVTRERAREIAAASKKGWADLTFADLEEYARQDAWLTWQAKWKQDELLEADGYVARDLKRQHLLGGLAYRMTRTGIRVNAERAEAGLIAAEESVAELAGKFVGTNLKSPKQLQALIFDEWGLPSERKTKTGGRSTDKDALEELAYDPRVADLIEFRRLAKQVDAYWLPLLDRLGDDGRVHPSFNPWRTVTGRWSCSGPNLYTIPRESTASAIRDVFEPDAGLVLSEWDLSQIEVRVGADMAKEEALLSVYEEGGDVYQAMADAIGCDRQTAKVVVLMLGYGAGPKKLAQKLAAGTGKRPDVARARRIMDNYWRTYPNLYRMNKGLEETAKRRGYVPLWKPGRRRLYKSPHHKFPRYYTAMNAAIQGGAACLFLDVLLELEPAIEDYGRIVLNVYDSAVIEHEPGAEDAISAILAEITGDCSPYDIATPWEHKIWRDRSTERRVAA